MAELTSTERTIRLIKAQAAREVAELLTVTQTMTGWTCSYECWAGGGPHNGKCRSTTYYAEAPAVALDYAAEQEADQ